ncbi:MAG: PHP domain-containing protein [Cellulosilyticaceae bacterium]
MFVNPYQNVGEKCQRSSFHTHIGTGPNTCGAYEIDEVLKVYKELDYGAICISNHNLYTDPAPYAHHGMCLFKGYEYTSDIHMVCLNSHQEAIDSCIQDGGFVILCHPNWLKEWSLSKTMVDELSGFAGIEIYNGSVDCGPIWDKDSNGRCNASNMFDYILSKGRLIWCFGNDDFHRWWMMAITWNMIYADKNEEDIMRAIREGAFYVSTGLRLEFMIMNEERIKISVINNEGFKDIYRYRFIGQYGQLLSEVVSENASYQIRGDEMYIRVEVTSSSGKMLYTQPVYDDSRFIKEMG